MVFLVVVSPREFRLVWGRDGCWEKGRVGDSPGSLNAMCPSSPIPPRKSSMPPYALIFSSYALHSLIRSFALPLRMFTCEGGMSTAARGANLSAQPGRASSRGTEIAHAPCEKNSRNMKVWYDSGWSSGSPTYSSMLNVMTCLKLQVRARARQLLPSLRIGRGRTLTRAFHP